ncbi:MAG: shikimate kinase [Thiohalorhabdus sp.]|uniref:shikimate kinase n=1 Tax=Thiohalorhabdus sp. TaxID=3094134 RepID=UPI00397FCE8A
MGESGRGKAILVGPMGSGKSTVGRALAQRLGAELVDLDAVIVERAGRAIPEIFAAEGEAGFRDREQAALEEVAARPGPLVVATGGGVVLREANRRTMAANGTVVYLRADVETLLERTAGDANRPLLQVNDPRAKLEALQAEREPLYRQAHLIVDTPGRTAQEVAEEILARLDSADPGAVD